MLSPVRTIRLRHVIETNQRLADDVRELQFAVLTRVQRLERELLSPELERLFLELQTAIDLTAKQGLEAPASIENASRVTLAPLPRGKAGGLARAKAARRYLDGTFMPESEKEEAYRNEYERHAAGGRARAATACRLADGRFA